MIGLLIFGWMVCGGVAVYLHVTYGKKEVATCDQAGSLLKTFGLGPISLYKVLTEDLKGQKVPWN